MFRMMLLKAISFLGAVGVSGAFCFESGLLSSRARSRMEASHAKPRASG